MVNETEKKDHAREQAKAQLESIVEMVKRLEHCQNCSGDGDCELTDKEIIEGTGYCYTEEKEVTEEERDQYHDEESARLAIEEDPLSVEVRKDWHTPGDQDTKPDEYNILLCTGGPACRIIGDLDEYGQPSSATIEYQDWFTPWTRYHDTTSDQDCDLLTYAQQLYFGE